MMTKKLLILIALIAILSAVEKYSEYGEIVLIDNMLYQSGFSEDTMPTVHINLADLAHRYGYISVEVLSAFIITKGALERLFPDEELPVRQDITITTTSDKGINRTIADILNANKDNPNLPINWIVSKDFADSLETVIIFERPSTGKKLEMRWVYERFMNANLVDSEQFNELKHKVFAGEATEEEEVRFKTLLSRMIRRTFSGQIAPFTGKILSE